MLKLKNQIFARWKEQEAVPGPPPLNADLTGLSPGLRTTLHTHQPQGCGLRRAGGRLHPFFCLQFKDSGSRYLNFAAWLFLIKPAYLTMKNIFTQKTGTIVRAPAARVRSAATVTVELAMRQATRLGTPNVRGSVSSISGTSALHLATQRRLISKPSASTTR